MANKEIAFFRYKCGELPSGEKLRKLREDIETQKVNGYVLLGSEWDFLCTLPEDMEYDIIVKRVTEESKRVDTMRAENE